MEFFLVIQTQFWIDESHRIQTMDEKKFSETIAKKNF